MPAASELFSLRWDKSDKAYLLTRDGVPCGSLIVSGSGHEFDIGSNRFRIIRKGFIKPRLNIVDSDERERGKVQRFGGFEPRIEMDDGSCFLHRELSEGQMNHAIFDCQGELLLETQDMSTWDCPSMRIDILKKGLAREHCAYLVAIAFFIFLEQRQGHYPIHADRC